MAGLRERDGDGRIKVAGIHEIASVVIVNMKSLVVITTTFTKTKKMQNKNELKIEINFTPKLAKNLKKIYS